MLSNIPSLDSQKQEFIPVANIEICHQAKSQQTSPEDAINSLEKLLLDYTDRQGLLHSSLTRFVEKTSSFNEKFFITKIPNQGRSGDVVYKVIGVDSHASLLMIKVFSSLSRNFIPEVTSLNYLNKICISGFSSPQIKALGKCYNDTQCYFLLSESVAPGETLMAHYKRIADHPFGSAERQRHFCIFLDGMWQCGTSLARLHATKQGFHLGLPQEYIEKAHEYLSKTIALLHKKPNHAINIDQLKDHLEALISDLSTTRLKTSIIHGDTKFENVLLDMPNTVTWIDPSNFINSLDSNLQAIGLAAKDLNSFIADFKEWQTEYSLCDNQEIDSREILSQLEIEQSIAKFKEGYLEIAKEYPSQKELEFFSFVATLYYYANDKTKAENYVPVEPDNSYRRNKSIQTTNELINALTNRGRT